MARFTGLLIVIPLLSSSVMADSLSDAAKAVDRLIDKEIKYDFAPFVSIKHKETEAILQIVRSEEGLYLGWSYRYADSPSLPPGVGLRHDEEGRQTEKPQLDGAVEQETIFSDKRKNLELFLNARGMNEDCSYSKGFYQGEFISWSYMCMAVLEIGGDDINQFINQYFDEVFNVEKGEYFILEGY